MASWRRLAHAGAAIQGTRPYGTRPSMRPIQSKTLGHIYNEQCCPSCCSGGSVSCQASVIGRDTGRQRKGSLARGLRLRLLIALRHTDTDTQRGPRSGPGDDGGGDNARSSSRSNDVGRHVKHGRHIGHSQSTPRRRRRRRRI